MQPVWASKIFFFCPLISLVVRSFFLNMYYLIKNELASRDFMWAVGLPACISKCVR